MIRAAALLLALAIASQSMCGQQLRHAGCPSDAGGQGHDLCPARGCGASTTARLQRDTCAEISPTDGDRGPNRVCDGIGALIHLLPVTDDAPALLSRAGSCEFTFDRIADNGSSSPAHRRLRHAQPPPGLLPRVVLGVLLI